MEPRLEELLFRPYTVRPADGIDHRLTCRTFVVPAGNDLLRQFGELVILAACSAKTRVRYRDDLAFFLETLSKAMAAGKLYGPATLRLKSVTSVDELIPICGDEWRIELVEGQEEAIARVVPKSVLRTIAAEWGEIWQLENGGVASVRVVFYHARMVRLPDIAAEISRVIGYGLAELVMVTDQGMMAHPSEEAVAVVRTAWDGLQYLHLIPRTLPIKDDVLYLCAQEALARKYAIIAPLGRGERAGRITTVLPDELLDMDLDQITDQGANKIALDLFGIQQTPLMYGATDIGGNVMELLQLWVACMRTKLPGIFNIELRAHNLGDYWERVLYPSLYLLGNGASLLPEMRRMRADRMSGADLFEALRIRLTDDLARLSHLPLGQFYLAVHQYLARRFNELLGANVQLEILEADLLFKMAAPDLTIGQAVDLIEEALGKRVLANHYTNSGQLAQIETDRVADSLRHLKVADYLAGPDAWPSGALTYLLMGAVAHHGPVWFDLKDSRLGTVSLAATLELPGMPGCNQGRYAISGVTRCYPVGRVSGTGDNIDPVVFAIMLERNERQMTQLIRTMVERWEFPLSPTTCGTVQIFQLGHAGEWSFTRMLDSQGGRRP